MLVRLWLPICDMANAWIVDPASILFGMPPWLALLGLATLMVLPYISPRSPLDLPYVSASPRSWCSCTPNPNPKSQTRARARARTLTLPSAPP